MRVAEQLQCPCGMTHQLSREHRRTLARIVNVKGDWIAVHGWAVSRVYAAIHGKPTKETVTTLAEIHGWGKVMTRE